MFRIDDASAAATLPVPGAAGEEGFFTEGDPASGLPGTRVRADWLNAIQEELRAIVVAGGLTPSKTTTNQVLTALRTMMNPQNSLSGNGYYVLPNGLILQWGQMTINHTGGTAASYTFNFPTAFPNAMLQGWISPGNNIASTSQPVVGSIEGVGLASCGGYAYSADTISRVWRILVIGF